MTITAGQLNVSELIRRTRDGEALCAEEIDGFVSGFASGTVPDYQMAAWLMAVRLRSLSRDETVALTRALMRSGQVLDWSGIGRPTADKHSTGGVGDKVSLILAPMVAACGVAVPMISGRSLGHTGGTVDKLESIPGFRTDLGLKEFRRVVTEVGVAIIGQTPELCPADQKIYALRDVTATVDSLPLIASSIMSKKLAEGASVLVLDVKTGDGAFMRRLADARRLARMMIGIGQGLGRKVVAFVTGMWQPLGYAVGNAVEVVESVECLKGRWSEDLKAVTVALGAEMLVLAGRAPDRRRALELLEESVATGRALAKFREMIAAQSGNPAVCDDYSLLPQPACRVRIRADRDGWVGGIDSLLVGQLGIDLRVGRRTVDSVVDHAAGFVFRRKAGDRVVGGEVIAEVLAGDRALARRVADGLRGAIRICSRPSRRTPLVLHRLVRA